MGDGRLARLLDVWRLGPGFTQPGQDVALTSRDGVALTASLLAGDKQPAVIIAHGFGGHRRKAAYVRLAERLAADSAVLSLDLRGHGESRGRCTLGDREVYDLHAAAAWLRARGHPWVAVVGVSMGATAALRCAAGRGPTPFDAVSTISAPSEFVSNGSPPVRALSTMVTSATWRVLVERALRVRVTRRWSDPVAAVEVAPRMAPTPLLLVHGLDDHFFPAAHAERLRDAVGPGAVVWLEPEGFGHAEDGLTVGFLERLAAAVTRCRLDGAWPEVTACDAPGAGRDHLPTPAGAGQGAQTP
jgi:pimeloyl-ACP methyl ester carboxylesterase